MLSIQVLEEEKAVEVLRGERTVGRLTYRLKRNGKALYPEALYHEAKGVRVEFGAVSVTDAFSIRANRLEIERKWRVEEAGSWQFCFDYWPYLSKNAEWVVPAVVYQENRFGKGQFPAGGLSRGWSFREDRIPVPSCSVLQEKDEVQAVFCSPAENEGELSSVKSFLVSDRPVFEIRIPYTERPLAYTAKGVAGPGMTRREDRSIRVSKKRLPYHYTRRFFVLVDSASHVTRSLGRVMDAAFAEFGKGRFTPIDWGRIASLKLHHLLSLLVERPEDGIAGLQMGKGNGFLQPYYEYTGGSFIIKSLEGAVILARAGKELCEPRLLELSAKMGACFLQGRLPNGLIQDMYSFKQKRWGGYFGVGIPKELNDGVNTRSNGEAMVAYLRLYRLLKETGVERKDFLEAAQENAWFFLTHPLAGEKAGSFGRWYDAGGTPLNTDGTNGAYIISELVELEKTTGMSHKNDEALSRAAAYYGRLAEKGAFYADTLDADCVDKEAGCALLHAFLDLYERDKKEEYLDTARMAADFVLSWVWTYPVAFPPKSPAGRKGLSTLGLTSVSVAHHHLDVYGLYIGHDFLRLWQATGEERWKQYAVLMIDACSQLVAGFQRSSGRVDRRAGWQPEQIDHTHWDYIHHRLWKKGAFKICIAWVPVLTLGALFDIRDRFPEVLDFRLDQEIVRKGITAFLAGPESSGPKGLRSLSRRL